MVGDAGLNEQDQIMGGTSVYHSASVNASKQVIELNTSAYIFEIISPTREVPSVYVDHVFFEHRPGPLQHLFHTLILIVSVSFVVFALGRTSFHALVVYTYS